jgi:hypothetical protein
MRRLQSRVFSNKRVPCCTRHEIFDPRFFPLKNPTYRPLIKVLIPFRWNITNLRRYSKFYFAGGVIDTAWHKLLHPMHQGQTTPSALAAFISIKKYSICTVHELSYPATTKIYIFRGLSNNNVCACGVIDSACTKIRFEYRTYLLDFESEFRI